MDNDLEDSDYHDHFNFMKKLPEIGGSLVAVVGDT